MKVITDFSEKTFLPIKIDDIISYILRKGFVKRITLHKEDVDPAEVAGFLLMRRDPTPYSIDDVADITYSSQLPSDWQRLVIAKELIHIVDKTTCRVSSRENVARLISDIVMPQSVQLELERISPQTSSDKAGILMALMLLMPENARNLLKELYDKDKISLTEIADIAKVPTGFVQIVMLDIWPDVTKQIISKYG